MDCCRGPDRCALRVSALINALSLPGCIAAQMAYEVWVGKGHDVVLSCLELCIWPHRLAPQLSEGTMCTQRTPCACPPARRRGHLGISPHAHRPPLQHRL